MVSNISAYDGADCILRHLGETKAERGRAESRNRPRWLKLERKQWPPVSERVVEC